MSRQDEFDEPGDMPDLAAMQADDALLDMIAYGETGDLPADDELARVLAAWTTDVDAEPLPQVFDGDVAVRMMRAASANARKRASHRKGSRPMLVPISAAAALVVVALSGVSVAAKSAEPGDPLFGVTKVLYSDYAKSAEAAEEVKKKIDEASDALDEGDPMEAQGALLKAQNELPDVKSDEGADDLKAKVERLLATLQARMQDPTPSEATAPSESTEPSSSPEPSEPPSTEPSEPSSTEPSEPSSTEPSTPTEESPPSTGDGSSLPPGTEPGATGSSGPEASPNDANTPTV